MDAGNPIRNVSLLPIELESQDLSVNPFHPAFLASLAGMTIIRFESWLKTDVGNNAARSWFSRVKPSDRQTTQGGVAIEYQIQLCNILQASPWFYLPAAANATDNYLSNFADLLTTTLEPSLSVYYEYAHGVGYLSWSKTNAIAVQNVWNARFDAMNQSSRLVHVHSSPYTSDIISHWGSDIHRLQAIAIPASVEALFGDYAFPLKYPTLTVDEALSMYRQAVLDAEASMNYQIQRIRSKGLKAMAYAGQVGTRAAKFAHRDKLSAALRCFSLRRFPCPVTVWDSAYNNGTGAFTTTYSQVNETFPRGFSRGELEVRLARLSRVCKETVASMCACLCVFCSQNQYAQAPARLSSELQTNWAARYTGALNVVAPATYNFSITANDGARLYVGGVLLINISTTVTAPVFASVAFTSAGPKPYTQPSPLLS